MRGKRKRLKDDIMNDIANQESFGGSIDVDAEPMGMMKSPKPTPKPKPMPKPQPGMMGMMMKKSPMMMKSPGMMKGPGPIGEEGEVWQIDFINRSTIVTDEQLQRAINAFQIQVDRDFAPAWATGATLSLQQEFRNKATIFIQDSGNVPSHREIDANQVPTGFVFADQAKKEMGSWQIAASNEMLSILVDPWANLAAQGVFIGSVAFFAYEACDPVEFDGGYEIDGIPVSNFLYPSWWVSINLNESTLFRRYDHLDTLEAPFTLSAGKLSYFRAVGNWMYVSSRTLISNEYVRFTRGYKRRKFSNSNYMAEELPLKEVPMQLPDVTKKKKGG